MHGRADEPPATKLCSVASPESDGGRPASNPRPTFDCHQGGGGQLGSSSNGRVPVVVHRGGVVGELSTDSRLSA